MKLSPDPHHDTYDKTTFGFWLFLLTDFMLFASLFATYAVLHHNTFGGPPASKIFHLSSAYGQTYSLLLATFFASLAGAFAHRQKGKAAGWSLLATLFFAALFLGLQAHEYAYLISKGETWQKSGFLSAYYTLVGMHTLHLLLGMIWLILLIFSVMKEGITSFTKRRITCTKLFWQ
ncbi:MAG: cytochrome o ubiquinol oxidase subunit III, partial [Chlamydiota bacterium]|nr:cytochrome o ubiquinol oxidase subunit III [Chlamydiota bacterium]